MLFQKSSLRAGFSVNQEQENEVNLIHNVSNNIINNENKVEEKENWYIEIPAISLKAEIAEGTTKEVMDKFVGHFEETTTWIGNVGLAAHNRGFPINYFEKVKDLKIGDEIIYKTPYGQRVYVVNLSIIIEQTDWSYLQETDDNRITLITCVSNKPEHRLCVQAIEKI